MYVKVKNLHNTSDRSPDGYASWKDFWVAKSGMSWPTYCSCESCLNKAEVGAHVIQVYGSNKWYIVPLCKYHNSINDEFYVNDIYLAPLY